MKKILLPALAVVLVYSCSPKAAPSSQPAAVNEVKPPANTPPAAAVKMESAEVTAGKNIYTTKCARCHGVKKVDDYTVQQWIPIMESMAPKARLDATEKTNVTAYVNFYAKSGS